MMDASAASSDVASTQSHPIRFHGNGKEYFGIWIVNILLTIITLGVYSAWAKVRTKRYFYGNTDLAGSRFEYLAQPIQILIGRIIAIVLLLVWFWSSSISPMISSGLLLGFAAIFPFLAVRNLRFDMRMTRYRNVRFNFTGSYGQGYWVFLGKPLLAYIAIFGPIIALTFGVSDKGISEVWTGIAAIVMFLTFLIVAPLVSAWVMSSIASFVINHTNYGDKEFNAVLEVKQYIKIFVKTIGVGLLVMLLGSIAVFSVMAMLFGGMEVLAQLGSQPDFKELIVSGAIWGLLVFYALMFVFGAIVNAYHKCLVRNYVFNQSNIDGQYQLQSTMETLPYAWLIFSNMLLLIVTLGLARPWTAVRHVNYLCERTAVEGDFESLATADHRDSGQSAVADEVADAFDIDLGVI